MEPGDVAARGNDRGAITAEFAIVLPVALLVVGLVLSAIVLATHRVALTSVAWELARLEARGDAVAAAEHLAGLPVATSVDRESRGVLHCVTLVARPGSGVLAAVSLRAMGCAARADHTPEVAR